MGGRTTSAMGVQVQRTKKKGVTARSDSVREPVCESQSVKKPPKLSEKARKLALMAFEQTYEAYQGKRS
jgi:hypothetical protein